MDTDLGIDLDATVDDNVISGVDFAECFPLAVADTPHDVVAGIAG
jgi:hypothetical protein